MKLALFIHVICISTWFGGLCVMAMYLRDSIRSNKLENMSYALNKVHKWNLTMFIPVALLALASGLFMLLGFGTPKPLWLLAKERIGSLVILLFVVMIITYGKKLTKNLSELRSPEELAVRVKRYIMILNLSLLVMTVLIFFVTFKP